MEISDCDQVTDVGINDGILSGKPKDTLRELNLGLLQNLTETVLYRLSYFYENLTYLDLGGNSIAVTDDSLQRIIRHMRFLKKLNLDSCCKVSLSDVHKTFDELEMQDYYFEWKLCVVFLACKQLTDYGFSGVKDNIFARRRHSIRNLRGLQILRCGGLYKLTDFSLIDAFMFNELKEVYFARCNVSDV